MEDSGGRSNRVGRPPTASGLPFAITFDRFISPAKLAAVDISARLLDGSRPYVRVIRIDTSCSPMGLFPAGARVLRCVTTDTAITAVAELDDATVLIEGVPRSTVVHVAAKTNQRASDLAEQIRGSVPRTSPQDVRVRIWHLGSNPSAEDRMIDAPSWGSISQNYPPAARRSITELMSIRRPRSTGKLILWHGEPGTGKTTALRALMRSWRLWCQPQYIADPEKFFSDPAYMTAVLTTAPVVEAGPTLDRAAQPELLWRLIVAEDSDEYLRSSARRDAGAALGRVLNLADGILGQGMNVMLLLTTNEPMSSLHPAIVRPGRCLASVEFPRFDSHGASQWLGAPARGSMTLAELLEARGELRRVGAPIAGESVGQYL